MLLHAVRGNSQFRQKCYFSAITVSYKLYHQPTTGQSLISYIKTQRNYSMHNVFQSIGNHTTLKGIKYGFLVILLTLNYTLSAQNLLPVKGRVIDVESGEPLPYATVYFNNSTYGATTNEAGEFQFAALPGKYDLIVNFFSYQPIIFPIELVAGDLKNYVFKMNPLEYDLPEISIESSRDEIWYRNYQTFKEQFLGTSSAAASCDILNPEVVIIDYNPATRIMTVRARDILQIRNKALGYHIQYLLERFEYDLGQGYVYFQGYPLFEEMVGSSGKQKKWNKARRKSYNGSVTHFMKSVIDGTVTEEGFKVTEIIKKPNINKPSAEEVANARARMREASARGVALTSNSPDVQIIRRSNESDYIRFSNNLPYPTDSLVELKDNKHQLYFPNLLKVRYTKEASEPAFLRYSRPRNFQESTLSLTGGATEVMPNGILADPLAVLFEGYMGWEKVGNMLPVDYVPEAQ